MSSGTLYIVSTPIGNLEDITLRALRVLREVDFIAAEDTRHSMKLLAHFQISKPMLSCWSQKERVVSRDIIERIRGGKDCALITDAGTPGISDPGSHTIREALKEGLRVVPVPGCSALTAALSVSGLNTECFMFLGFLPLKRGERIRSLQEVSSYKGTLVFYEAPHRIVESLKDMLETLGDRKAALAREITKFHEQMHRGALSEVIALVEGGVIAGEYVIVLEGSAQEQRDVKDALKETLRLIGEGMSRKEAAKKAGNIYGVKSKDLYDMSIGGKCEPDKTKV